MKMSVQGLTTLCILGLFILIPTQFTDATEEPILYDVSVVKNTTGFNAGCEVTGAGQYEAGTEVTLTAIATEGYHLTRWTSNETGTKLSTSPSYTFIMPAKDLQITAQFNKHIEMGVDLGDGNHSIRCDTCNLVIIASEPHSDEGQDLHCDICYAHTHIIGPLQHNEWIHWNHCDTCDADVNLEAHVSFDDNGICSICGTTFEWSHIMIMDSAMYIDSLFELSYPLYFTPSGSITIEPRGCLSVPTDTDMEIVIIGDGEIITMMPGSTLMTGDVFTPIVEPWTLGLDGNTGIVTNPNTDGSSSVDIDVSDESTFTLGGFKVTGGDGNEITTTISKEGGLQVASVELDLPKVEIDGYNGSTDVLELIAVSGTVSLEVSETGLSMDSINSVDGNISVVTDGSGSTVFSDIHITNDGSGFDVEIGSDDKVPDSEGDGTYYLAIIAVLIIILVIIGIFIHSRRP